MSDNSEPIPTQSEVSSGEQLVGLVPIEGEDHNIGVQLIGSDTEDFFGTQAIELNGERHVIVSQAQDPETGEMLLVLRGENGEHIAIQSEALSSMVQASGGDHIQVAVETQDETLTLSSDLTSVTHTVSATEPTSESTTCLSPLPPIIANIPSQTQTTTAPTNVVQAIETPRVSQEEQPSSLTTLSSVLPIIPSTESDEKTDPKTTASVPLDIKEEEKKVKENIITETNKHLGLNVGSEDQKQSKVENPIISTKDSKISQKTEEKTESKPQDVSKTETKEDIEKDGKKTTQTKTVCETNKLDSNEIPFDKKSDETNVPTVESIPTTNSDSPLISTSDKITTSSVTTSEAVVSTSSPKTLTTTSITSEAIPTSVPEDKVTTTTTESVNSVPELGFGNTAVIQVQDSGNDSSLEQLMANVVQTADGNYVLMAQTEDGQMTGLPSDINLSDVINAGAAGGQTFLIETPEGLVACTASTADEDGSIRLIQTEGTDIESAVMSSAQNSGTSIENQIIQAISGGQGMSYTFNSTSGCLELTAVNSQNSTPTQKPSRGGRGSRSNKSKALSSVPSMGQTLLLTADTESTAVTTKPSTPASSRSRGGGGRGRANKINAIDSHSTDSNINSNQIQSKANPKVQTNETLKTSAAKGSTETVPPGPSQLAASRRTYSKKSNIVWITPDASQGANSTTFATVATASVKASNISQNQTTATNCNSTVAKTIDTTQSSRMRSPSPTKVSGMATTQPISSPKPKLTQIRSPSPTKSVSTPLPNSSLTGTKPIESITKSIVTTNVKTTPIQTTSATKKETTPKTNTNLITSKTVTASKTMASKSGIQSSPSKGQTTPNLTIQSPVTSTETITKTTIRMSDITATKTSVEPSVAKTATKTLVTVSPIKSKTSLTKSDAITTPSSVKSSAPTTPSNKTVSLKRSSVPPITRVESTTTSTKPITISSSVKSKTNTIISTEKVQKSPQMGTPISEAKPSVATKQIKGKDTLKEISTPVAIKSNVTSDATSVKSSANSTEKSVKKSTEKGVSNRVVETRHSSRLSPSKSIKTDTQSKEMDAIRQLEQNSSDLVVSKVETSKEIGRVVTKSKSELENDDKKTNKSQPKVVDNSTEKPKTEETENKSKMESKTEAIEENKSIRKSRRSSRNTMNLEENKKEDKNEENKSIEIKTKEIKDIKEKTVKEKAKELGTETISTRRTSRKKDLPVEDKPEESVTPASVPVTTTETSTPTVETKPLRQTRASSGKKSDTKQLVTEEKVSKTPDTKTSKQKETDSTETKVDAEFKSDFDRIMEETKPVEKTPEKSEPISTKTSETSASTRSIKKRVQFEIKEKDEEKETKDNNKSLVSVEKTPEIKGPTPRGRRSLRSTTPQSVNQTEKELDFNENIEKSENEANGSQNRTPQRFSTRKRKEVTKALEIEVKEVTKSPKKAKKTEEIDINKNSKDSPSVTRLRDRKSKTVKRFEPKNSIKPLVRHSIEGSDPFSRINRKQSLIQSFIDENEWKEKEEKLRRKTISSLSDLRSPNECYDYSTNECRFYIRHQSASLTPKQSTGNYLCQKCGFHTTRINNLVIHHKDQCSYAKNAVIQQWQTELQKRVRPSDTALTASTSSPETKRRKTENNDELNHNLDKTTDLSEDESEDEEMATSTTKSNQNPTISDIDAMLNASDDEDLLSIDNIEKPKREFGFSEEDIVWVETNGTHWPALVSKVFPKEKKALIRLIDSPWPKKSIKAEISSISLFDSAEVNKQYLREGRKGSNGDVLVKAVQKAEEFLRKKCLGNELSAAKFFDQIDSDVSETNADEDERLSPNIGDGLRNDSKETTKPSDSVNDTSLEPIGSNGDDLEDDKMPESNEAIAQWKEKRRQQNAKLLQCIKDGKVETHLVGVYRETISSERHLKFKNGSESEKNQLKHVPWFGPIDDEEQQEEIYDYCSQLFKSNFKTDGSFDTVAYIFEVWVPEAIVKAISRVRRIELKDSESIFAKGVILSKTETDEMKKEIQKEAEKHLTSQNSSD